MSLVDRVVKLERQVRSLLTPVGIEATIARDVMDTSDLAIATSDGVQYDPAPWPLRGAALPQRGDRCLVIVSNEGDTWIVGWWPT